MPTTPAPTIRPITKILIANRGEIALRIIRACRELSISTVAVYSDADRAALHVLAADEAYRLGPAPASESYLRGDLILDVARLSHTDAIHPGYGFLSENPAFAEACEAAGVLFIGPPAAAMRALGSKTLARQAADRANMPRVPGSVTGLASLEEAMAVATEIGLPVMLKAAAGGGGKGMREVHSLSDLPEAFVAASSEAERSFGSSEVYLEKLIVRPRHIEIQLLADHHGTCLYLGERECSVQRRHQKVIEEAPSAVVSPALRRRMGEAAVRLALSAGYRIAGSVEFLVDAAGTPAEAFYFLEMNTRLQVEHPVTELITGLDLVRLQISIAEGHPLTLTQADILLRGHAIECRIYAEDPDNNFFPSPGRITQLIQPGGPGIREDAAIYPGYDVPIDYDPMLSKLIVYADTREAAIARMLAALDQYVIGGIKTNLSLFRRILLDPDFRASRIDTSYLERLLANPPDPTSPSSPASAPKVGSNTPPELVDQIAAIAAAFFTSIPSPSSSSTETQSESPWTTAARREALRS